LRPNADSWAQWQRFEMVFAFQPSGSGQGRVSLVPPTGEAVVVTEEVPDDPAEAEGWARTWAAARLAAKKRKDYKEADRVRDFLQAAGWEVRDNKDGTAEVRRIGG
jgi:hypothetical protein